MISKIESIPEKLKRIASVAADLLNKASRGKLKPNTVTLIGLLLHLPVGWLIIDGNLLYAGLALIIVASLDALDGALARLQKSTSDFGAWCDACSDRLKETIILSALAYYLAENQSPLLVGLCVAALGVSVLISYIKAKGEGILAARFKSIKSAELNSLLRGGFLSYEWRVFIIAAILISQQFTIGLAVVIIGGFMTLLQRTHRFKKSLKNSK